MGFKPDGFRVARIGVVYMIVVLLLIFIGIGLLYLTINGAGKSIETQNTELVSE